jgi:hypothetical protein
MNSPLKGEGRIPSFWLADGARLQACTALATAAPIGDNRSSPHAPQDH